MRRLLAVFMASALLLGVACSSGDKNSDSGGSAAPEIVNEAGVAQRLYQPAGVVGPDSFSPSFELTAYQVTSEDPVLTGEVSASTPGIYRGRTYGGTGENICDIEKMIEFLTYYEDRGRAWAEIQGIQFEELASFIRGLEPVYVTQDVNVRMYGFKDGAAYGYEAIIGAGTAILIDDQGIPRARCACGNPLSEPQETPESTTTSESPNDTQIQTEETIPADTTPADTTPDVSIPTDSTPPDSVPEDSIPPIEDDPCPELIDLQYGKAVSYTDSNGETWVWDAFSGLWRNTDDPSAEGLTDINDIPGYTEECGDPEITIRNPCPEEYQGSRYTDPSGTEWVWVGVSTGGANWFNADEFGRQTYLTTAELPGIDPNCIPPTPADDDPVCPEVYEGAQWTDPDGNVWTWVSDDRDGPNWWRSEEGVDIYVDTYRLPGVPVDCPQPQPCPPLKSYIGQQWTDASGNVWVYGYGVDGYPTWDNQSTPDTNENYDRSELPGFDDCYPPRPAYECPPEKGPNGTTWTDGDGVEWVYRVGINGEGAWDRSDTEDVVEQVSSYELPGASDCFSPEENPCPPLQPENGAVWHTSDGRIYVYRAKLGLWVNPRDDADSFTVTVALPGYYDQCLPPCPPLSPSPDESAFWIDPATGQMWTWTGDSWESEAGDSVESTGDLPWYRVLCLPPCTNDDGSGEQQQSWVEDENGNPVTNTEAQTDAGSRPAITIAPGAPAIEEAVREKLARSSSAYDDCNPVGCLGEGETPVAGHVVNDSNGTQWVYGGDGQWYGSGGETTDDVTNIPGYVETCYPQKIGDPAPGDSTPDSVPSGDPGAGDPQPCPPEYEGNTYTNSEGITFIWTGGNSRNRPSDHGEHWYNPDYPDDDGDLYRYTYQLEPDGRFGGCPSDAVDPQAPFVDYRAMKFCANQYPAMLVNIWVSTGVAVSTITATADGADLYSVSMGADGALWGVSLVDLGAGNHTVVVDVELVDGTQLSFSVPVSLTGSECNGGIAVIPRDSLLDGASPSTTAAETTTTAASSRPVFSVPTLTVVIPRISIPTNLLPVSPSTPLSGPTTTVAGSPTPTTSPLIVAPIITLAPIRPIITTTTAAPRATTTTTTPLIVTPIMPTLAPIITVAPIRPIILPTTTTTTTTTTLPRLVMPTLAPIIISPIRITTTTVKKP